MALEKEKFLNMKIYLMKAIFQNISERIQMIPLFSQPMMVHPKIQIKVSIENSYCQLVPR